MRGQALLDLPDALASTGCEFDFEPGWQSRARSTGGFAPPGPLAVIIHHTASDGSDIAQVGWQAYNSPGRPIVQLYLGKNGRYRIIAAGCANTNGKGIARRFSKGTIPAGQGNLWYLAIEVSNGGLGTPYPEDQIEALFRGIVGLHRRYGMVDSDVDEHEYYAPGRKIDPARAGAVLGPWQPRSKNGVTGTWLLDDVIANVTAWRMRLFPETAPTVPPITPGDDDMAAPILIQAAEDDRAPTFWLTPQECGQVQDLGELNLLAVTGHYVRQGNGQPFRLPKHVIDALIRRRWTDDVLPPEGYPQDVRVGSS